MPIEYVTFDAHIPGNKNAIYTHEISFNRYDENFRTQFLSDVLKLHKDWRVVIVGVHHNRNIATEISSILFAMATDRHLETFQLVSEANNPTKEVRF